MKALFWIMLIANMAFFGIMHWGAQWFAPPTAEQALPELNPQKIALQKLLRPVSMPAATSSVAPALQCIEWAEFSAATLPQAQSSIAQLPVIPTLRTIEYSSEYWVYIPPIKNPAKMKQKLAELTAAGLNGVVETTAGQWQRAISLGTFPNKDLAQAFATEHHNISNLKVGEYRPAYQTSVLQLNNLDSTNVAKLTELQKQFPDSQLNPVSCR